MREPSLPKIALTSTLLHLLFIALIIIPFTSRQKEFRNYNYFVNLVEPIESPGIKPAPRVKKKPKAVQKTVTVKTKSKPKSKPKPHIPSSKSVDKVSKEIERLRAISVLSELKKLRSKVQEIRIGGKTAPKPLKEAGIAGRGTGGDTNYYYSLIKHKIWQQWVYPDFKTSGLEVIVLIRIGKDGRIISQGIEKTSGDMLFDRSAMKAISKASPLPPPPREMEIGLRFYL